MFGLIFDLLEPSARFNLKDVAFRAQSGNHALVKHLFEKVSKFITMRDAHLIRNLQLLFYNGFFL